MSNIQDTDHPMKLTERKACAQDVEAIIHLLVEDELGSSREIWSDSDSLSYFKAFDMIDKDPNQYLMVVESGDEIVATCHLTIMPSLTYKGSIRMQIEAVRTKEKYRGRKIGEWMMRAAFDYAKSKGVSLIQLTTNKQRPGAKHFYEKFGFVNSHEARTIAAQLGWGQEGQLESFKFVSTAYDQLHTRYQRMPQMSHPPSRQYCNEVHKNTFPYD